MNLFDVYPINNIAITKAKGSYVWDENGQQYLDMYGGHAVISIGHTHPHYVKRITDQLHKVGVLFQFHQNPHPAGTGGKIRKNMRKGRLPAIPLQFRGGSQ